MTFQAKVYNQTPERVRDVVSRIRFKDDFSFVVSGDSPEDMKLQVQYWAPDVAVAHSPPTLRTGALLWAILKTYGPRQIMQRAFLTVKNVEEHEIRENFRYQGLKIFNPHFVMDDLIVYLQKHM